MRSNSAIQTWIVCYIALSSAVMQVVMFGPGTGKLQANIVMGATNRTGQADSSELVATLVPSQALLTATVNLRNPSDNESFGPHVTPLNFMQRTRDAPIFPSKTLPTMGPASTNLLVSASPVNSSLGFDGLNQVQSCNCVPPDVQVAAGLSSLIEMVNLETEIFSKQGSSIMILPLSTFFNTGIDSLSDPKVLFDAPTGRFFASILDISGSSIKVAVSATGDPAGTWNIYTLGTGGKCPDQPIIGINDDKFVASANDFTSCSRSGRFSGAQFWVLNKSEMVAGATIIDLSTFGPNSSLFSVHPVHSLSFTTTEFMVSTGSGSKVSAVQIFSITGVPPGTVAVSMASLSISTVNLPPGGVQPGTSVLVNTDDARVEDAVWFQGKIWYALNDGCIPASDTVTRSCLRLTQTDTSTSTVIQDFDFGASGQYYFYPALGVDSLGNLDVIYGYSSSTIFPSLAATGRAASDPLRSLAQPRNLKLGSADETTGRYGDYFGAGVDPSSPTVVWVAGEYISTTGGVWSTFIANMSVISSNFIIAASPQISVLTPGLSAKFNVSLTSVGTFTGTVSVSATVSPVVSNGPTAVLNPMSLNLTAGVSRNSTLTVYTTSTTSAGNYSVTIIGTSGSLSHSLTVSIQVFDFSISNSGAIVVVQGSSGSTTINVTLLGGPSASVSLSCTSGLPSGTSCSFLPSSGLPTFTSILTIPTSSLTPIGSYTVTVVGSSGGISHTTQISLSVETVSLSIGDGRPSFRD